MRQRKLERHLEFVGTEKIDWRLSLEQDIDFSDIKISKKQLKYKHVSDGLMDCFFAVDNFVSADMCQYLISEFDKREDVYPVGVDGYVEAKDKDSIGSYRSNAWAVDVAQKFLPGLQKVLKEENDFKIIDKEQGIFETNKGRKVMMPAPKRDLSLLGTTPYMRFMKYFAGGQHVPHYDALFLDEKRQYISLMSWVLYLNTPLGTDGHFQFTEDNQGGLIPENRDRSDWKRMADSNEIIASIAPKQGRLLIFPHWLAHQVQRYEAQNENPESRRIIVRGDIAYGWNDIKNKDE